MVDLTNIKHVVFDFDDTLCIHTRHTDGGDGEYNIQVLKGENPWKDCNPNSHLKKFMNICHNINIEMHLMSATTSYKHMELKQKYVLDNYGYNLDNLCVGSADAKVEMLKALVSANGIYSDNVLFIDDLCDTLAKAGKLGIIVATPMEVVNYIESILTD